MQLARRQRIEHAVMTHGDAVIDGDGVEFLGDAAGLFDLAGHQLAEILEVHVARHELGEGVDDGDDRLAEIASPSCRWRARGRGRRPCCGHGWWCGSDRRAWAFPVARRVVLHRTGARSVAPAFNGSKADVPALGWPGAMLIGRRAGHHGRHPARWFGTCFGFADANLASDVWRSGRRGLQRGQASGPVAGLPLPFRPAFNVFVGSGDPLRGA